MRPIVFMAMLVNTTPVLCVDRHGGDLLYGRCDRSGIRTTVGSSCVSGALWADNVRMDTWKEGQSKETERTEKPEPGSIGFEIPIISVVFVIPRRMRERRMCRRANFVIIFSFLASARLIYLFDVQVNMEGKALSPLVSPETRTGLLSSSPRSNTSEEIEDDIESGRLKGSQAGCKGKGSVGFDSIPDPDGMNDPGTLACNQAI